MTTKQFTQDELKNINNVLKNQFGGNQENFKTAIEKQYGTGSWDTVRNSITGSINTIQNKNNPAPQNPAHTDIENKIKTGSFDASTARQYNTMMGDNSAARNTAIQNNNQNLQSNFTPEEIEMQKNSITSQSGVPSEVLTTEKSKENTWGGIDTWKASGSNPNDLSQEIERRYNTVVDYNKENNTYKATIGNDIYEWSIDEAGNPRKTKIGSVNDPEKKKSEFQNMLSSGVDTKILANFVNKNIDYKDDFALIYKNHLKEKTNIEFVSKYSSMSKEDLYDQVKNGNLVVGSNQYNLLPEEQRKNFENYKIQKDIALSFEKTDLTGSNKVLSMDSFLSEIKTIFNSNLRKTANEMLNNNPEINKRRNNAENLENQIYAIDDDLEVIAKDIGKSMPGTPQSLVNAEIAVKQEALIKKRNSLLRELQIETSAIANIKQDMQYEIELMKYDDAREKENFQIALNMYNNERSRMDQFTMLDFQEKSKQMAEQRQQMFQLQIKDIDQKFQSQREQTQREYDMFKTEDQRAYDQANKKGVYQTDRNGNLLYVIDGKATPVLNTNGTVVGITKEKGYSDSIQRNAETGGYDVFRVYDDGRLPDVFSYGVDGKNLNGSSMQVWDAISGVSDTGRMPNGGVWCGEGVNKYLKNIGVSNLSVGDSYESKKKYVNSQTPQVGGLAVWNPNPEGKYGENGHIGIVTGYNASSGTIEITDWNAKGDGKKNTYTVPVSQINNSDGGFVHLNTKGQESSGTTGGYNTQLKPIYEKYNSGKMTQNELETYAKDSNFLAQAEMYGQEKAKPGYDSILRMIEIAESVKDLGPIERLYPDNATDIQRLKDKAGMQELINLKSNGATFGSLTEKEFERIQNSIINSKGLTSADKWNEILDDYINVLKKGLPAEYLSQVNGGGISTGGSILDEFQNYNSSGVGSSVYTNNYQNILNR